MNKSFGLWILSFILAAIYGGYALSNRQVLSTDILSILSDSNQHGSKEFAKESYDADQSRQLVLTYTNDSEQIGVTAFKKLAAKFCEGDFFASCDFLAEKKLDPKGFFEFYKNFQAYIIPKELQNKIISSSEKLVNDRYTYLLSPLGSSELSYLERDPLGLMPGFFRSLNMNTAIHVENSLYTVNREGKNYYFIFAELNTSWREKTNSITSYIETFRRTLSKGEDLFALGASLYFEAGSKTSMNEANVLAVLSLAIVSILLFFAFGSLLPMLSSVLCIVYSVLVAFSISVYIFDQIHVFVFLMGISLMGVICDYCIHYYSHRLKKDNAEANEVFSSIRKALFLSLLSSCLGYASFSFSGIDLLRQLSIFAVIGLLAAYFSVYAFLGALSLPETSIGSNFRSFLVCLTTFKDEKLDFINLSVAVKTLFLLAGLVLVCLVNFDFDIRKLQKKDNELVLQENLIKELSGIKSSGDYYLVSADSLNSLLLKEEELRSHFGSDVVYNSLSKWVPSIERQKASKEAFDKLNLISKALFAKLGVGKKIGDIYSSTEGNFLKLEDWLKSSVSWRQKSLFLGNLEGRFYSVLPIFSHDFTNPIENSKDIQFVSKTNDYTEVFSTLGTKTLWAIGIIFCLLFFVTSFKEGLSSGFDLYYAALMGLVFSIGVSNLFVGYIDFFHILGAFLVFFLAVDYSFFCRYANDGEISFLRLGLFLSAFTSLCSFGILTFSSTNAVSHFGMSLSIGIFVSYLLSFVKAKDLE